MVFKSSEIYLLFLRKAILWQPQGADTAHEKHLWNCTLIFSEVKCSTLTSLHSSIQSIMQKLGIRGLFFSSHPSCWHHRPRSLRQHSWTFCFTLNSQSIAACPPSLSVIRLTPQPRLARCQKVLSFPYSPKYTQKPLFDVPWERGRDYDFSELRFHHNPTRSLVWIERIQGKNSLKWI